jgi:hypothetical protein
VPGAVYDAGMQKEKAEVLVTGRAGGAGHGRVLVMMIAGALIVQGVLRGWVAVGLLMSSGIEGQLGGLVHWRVFDGFVGWVALMILAMTEEEGMRGGWMARAVLGVGVVAFVGSLLMGEVENRAMVEIGVAGVLAIAGALVAGRQVVGLARKSKEGLNIEQLWRGVAAQWVLLWVAAEVTLRIRFWKEGVEAEETARALLFLLPVVGVVVNVMMAVGIRWWGAMREETGKVRVRAWVVAMGFVNIGAVGVIVGTVWARGVGVAGALVMIAGIAMYLIGFPKRAWRAAAGGGLVAVGFGVLAIGLLMIAGELSMQRSDVPTLYSAAWRHVLTSAQVLWLLGMGSLALAKRVPTRVAAGTKGVVLMSRWMVLAGVVFVAGVLIVGIFERDMVRGLFVGADLELAGVVLGTAVALRAGRGMRAASGQ